MAGKTLGEVRLVVLIDIDKADRELQRLAGRTEDVGDAAHSTSGKTGKLGQSFSAIRLKALAAAAAVTGIVIALGKTLGEYAAQERGLREVGTLMGGLTDGQMRAMRAELEGIAAATGQAMDALTKAKYDIVSAGFANTADSAKVLAAAADLAVGGVTEVSTAADLLTTTLNAYNLTSESSVDISDKLFTIVKLGKTTMTELGGSMGRVLAIAGQAGVGLDEVGAAMATLTAQGQSTEEATTGIRAAIVQLLKPGKELEEVIEGLGHESGQALLEQEGLAGAVKLVYEAAERSGKPMTDMFESIEAIQAILPLTGTAAEKFSDNMAQMGESAGAAEDAVAEMEKSVGLQMDKLKQKFHNYAIEIGSFVVPAVLTYTSTIDDLLTKPLSEKLREEQIEFNTLVGVLKDANTHQETRNRAIEELQANYSDYLDNLDLESASIGEIAKAQEKANATFREAIRLQAGREIIAEQIANQQKAMDDLVAAEIRLKELEILWGSETEDLTEKEEKLKLALELRGIETDKAGTIIEDQRGLVEKLKAAYEEEDQTLADLLERLRSLGIDLSDVTGKTDEQTEAIKEQTEAIKEQAEAVGWLTEAQIEAAQKANAVFQAYAQAVGMLGQNLLNLRKAQIKNEMDAQIKAVLRSTKSEQEKADEISNIREQAVQDEKDAARRMVWIQYLQAIASTAGAIVKALPNIPLSIIIGLAGLAQIATIKVQHTKIAAAAEGLLAEKPMLALLGEDTARSGAELVVPEKSFRRWVEESINPRLVAAGTDPRTDILISEMRGMRRDMARAKARQVVEVVEPSLYEIVVDQIAPHLKEAAKLGQVDVVIKGVNDA